MAGCTLTPRYFHQDEDRMRRRYKASTIHGWLRMWRGTLAGNERVRQQGRYEMKMARAMRRQKSQTAGGNGGPFSLFRWGSQSNRRTGQAAASTPQRHKSSSSQHHRSRSRSQSQKAPRPTTAQRKSSTSSSANKRHHHQRGHAPARPEPMRHRSSHSKTKPSRQSPKRR
jgi:hypothetical protein